MPSENLIAYHYGTGQPIQVTWSDGLILSIDPAPNKPSDDIWIAPPLLDIQINGYAGIDFQQDNLSVDQLLMAVRGLRGDGCTRFLLTLITDAWPSLLSRLKHLSAVRATHPELMEAILGWHLEGPFLSPEPGFHGAHDPALMMDPLPEHIDTLKKITRSDILLLTMAPERAGADQAIAYARDNGVFVHFGHTNASLDTLKKVTTQRSVFTHLGNACPQQLDRHDNIVWRALDTPDLWCSLIADGIHVSPSLFRLIHKIKAEKVIYTTDAMSAAGAPPGRYPLGRIELEVGEDRVVRQPGRTNFAGSACTPLQGVLRAAHIMGEPWQKAWKRFSEQPGKVLNLDTRLLEGAPANFCIADCPPPADPTPPRSCHFQTYYHGRPTEGGGRWAVDGRR